MAGADADYYTLPVESELDGPFCQGTPRAEHCRPPASCKATVAARRLRLRRWRVGFVVSRVLKYLEVRVALFILPAVALIGYTGMAVIPILSFIRTVKLAENSIDYSLQSTTRNALYLPTNREAKYKAKQANDGFFVRFGDVLSAGLVFAGTRWLSFGSRQFALVNVVLIAGWLALAFVIGRQFEQLSVRLRREPKG
jgi:ATP/ADP translocase